MQETKTGRKTVPPGKIEILYHIIEAISSGSELEKILKDTVDIIVEITESDSCFIYLKNGNGEELVLRASKNPHPKLLGRVKLKLGEGITGWVAGAKKPVSIPENAYSDERFKLFNNIPEDRYEAFLSIPILVKGRVIGVVNVQHRKKHVYRKSMISFLMAVTGQLGSVIENTKLYDELRRKEKQMETLSRVSETVVSDRYLDSILNLVVAVTAEMMDSNICSLMLIDESRGELVIKATQSISDEYKHKPSIKIEKSIIGRVVKEKKPLAVTDVSKEPSFAYPELVEKTGIVSMLAVPMVVKNNVIGVINVYTSVMHWFSEGEISVLQTVANQAAIAIESARLVDEIMKSKEQLEVRKTVEKAKGIIMKEKNLAEEDAYKMIRKKSMDSCKSMKEISESIILASEYKKFSAGAVRQNGEKL